MLKNNFFPEKTMKLAQLLCGREFGSESILARSVRAGGYDSVDIGLGLAWLDDLSLGIHCAKICKKPNIQKLARAALNELAKSIVDQHKNYPELKRHVRRAQEICAEQVLAELGMRF